MVPKERIAQLTEGFARAAEAAGGVARDDYVVADSRVSLRFASPALRERLTRAFAHLAAPRNITDEAALTVHLWDSASTSAPRPPLPRVRADDAPGALYHFEEPPLRGVYQQEVDALSILDTSTGTAWYWTANVVEQPSWDLACPIRQILFWWLGSRDYLQVHGAAVGTPAGGVLVVGQPGSGKSTVALACLGSDLLYAGDDYVAVTLEPPRVASLFNSGKLEPAHVRELLPNLLPFLANADRLDGEKAVLYAHEHFPQQTTSGFPIAAVVVPAMRVDRREPQFVSASRAAAFAALGPSTIFQLHTAGATELAILSSLVARLPSYTLELGTDLSAIPGKIADLLSIL